MTQRVYWAWFVALSAILVCSGLACGGGSDGRDAPIEPPLEDGNRILLRRTLKPGVEVTLSVPDEVWQSAPEDYSGLTVDFVTDGPEVNGVDELALNPLGGILDLGPDGRHFEGPLQLEVTWPEGTLPDEDAERLSVYTLDESRGRWERVTVANRDLTKRRITAQVDHFSYFVAASAPEKVRAVHMPDPAVEGGSVQLELEFASATGSQDLRCELGGATQPCDTLTLSTPEAGIVKLGIDINPPGLAFSMETYWRDIYVAPAGVNYDQWRVTAETFAPKLYYSKLHNTRCDGNADPDPRTPSVLYLPLTLADIFDDAAHIQENGGIEISGLVSGVHYPSGGVTILDALASYGQKGEIINAQGSQSLRHLTADYVQGRTGWQGPAVYWHVDFPDDGVIPGRVYLTYWTFYPWDPKSPELQGGAHPLDREALVVELFCSSPTSCQPTSALYGMHVEEQTMYLLDAAGDRIVAKWKGDMLHVPWTLVTKDDRRPVAYVAYGSHALYPRAGIYYVDPHIISDEENVGEIPASSFGGREPACGDGRVLSFDPGNGEQAYSLRPLDMGSISTESADAERAFLFSGFWVDGVLHKNARFPPFLERFHSIESWRARVNWENQSRCPAGSCLACLELPFGLNPDPNTGHCDGDISFTCDSGSYSTENCAASGQVCGWSSATERYVCRDSCTDEDGDGHDGHHTQLCPGGDDLCDDNDTNWSAVGCAWCEDNDGDGYGTDCDLGDDCNDNDHNIWTGCTTCTDVDGDGRYGFDAALCPSGHDQCDWDAKNWSATGCSDCADADGDGYGADCDFGRDCDETSASCWSGTCCPPGCQDGDGDGYDGYDASLCLSGDDLCDADPHNWTTIGCTSCIDTDGDGRGVDCDQGVDCDEIAATCWSGPCCPSGCVDSDGDGHSVYDAGTCPNGDDACDNDPNNWTTSGCTTCVDGDGDGYGSGCDNGDDCDDGDPIVSSGCNSCGDGVRDAFENCDGSDLGGGTCTLFGFTTGQLSCNSSCTFDLSGCQPSAVIIEGIVWSPGSDLASTLENNRFPVPNVRVIAHTTDPTALPTETYCNSCGSLPSDVQWTFSDPVDGSFQLLLAPNTVYNLTLRIGGFRRIRQIVTPATGTVSYSWTSGQPRTAVVTLPASSNLTNGDEIPNFGILSGAYEDMEPMFTGLGFLYDGPDIQELNDPVVVNSATELSRYHVLLVPDGDGWPGGDGSVLREWVAAGGVLWVDGFSYDFVEVPWPDFLSFYDGSSECGSSSAPASTPGICNNWSSYDFNGLAGYSDLSGWLLLATVNRGASFILENAWNYIHTLSPGVVGVDPACGSGPNGEVYQLPDVWMYNNDGTPFQSSPAPVTVSWPYGCGRVVYTVFHTYSGSQQPYELLFQEKIMMNLIMQMQSCRDGLCSI
jgi:hypothetical protein